MGWGEQLRFCSILLPPGGPGNPAAGISLLQIILMISNSFQLNHSSLFILSINTQGKLTVFHFPPTRSLRFGIGGGNMDSMFQEGRGTCGARLRTRRASGVGSRAAVVTSSKAREWSLARGP